MKSLYGILNLNYGAKVPDTIFLLSAKYSKEIPK